MMTDVPVSSITERIYNQLRYVVAYDPEIVIEALVNSALKKMEIALSPCRIKHVKSDNEEPKFSSLHIGQWSMFIYFLSRLAAEAGELDLAEHLSFLNGQVGSIFLNHKVDMPEHFYLDHSLGTIIGRATIQDYFFCAQHCTIGSVHKGGKDIFPRIGMHVEMMANSSVIGECNVGDYVIFGANTFVINRDIPSNSIVYGRQDSNLTIKQLTHEEMLKHLLIYPF